MVVTRSMTGATKKPDTRAEAARAVQKTTEKHARASKKATAKSKRAGKKLTRADKEGRKAKSQERRLMTEARNLFLYRLNTFRVQHMDKHPEIPVVGDVWIQGLAEWDSLTDSAKGEYAAQVQQRKVEEENIRQREIALQAPPNRKRWIEYAKLPHVRERRMAGDKKWWDGFVESTST